MIIKAKDPTPLKSRNNKKNMKQQQHRCLYFGPPITKRSAPAHDLSTLSSNIGEINPCRHS